MTTTDKSVVELKLDRVDLIKTDIKGAERRALARYKPRLAIASYHLPDDHKGIPAAVRRAHTGYRMSCRSCTLTHAGLVPEVLFY